MRQYCVAIIFILHRTNHQYIMKKLWLLLFICTASFSARAQEDSTLLERKRLDSLFIEEVESQKGPNKVLHAEPLFIDLIRDLGARKGEKEWNIGIGLSDNNNHDLYTALIEYEFAPVHRLGLEVELPFSFSYPHAGSRRDSVFQGRLNSLKLAAQYTFFVSDTRSTSLALGYIHEFELVPFHDYRHEQLYFADVFNPFFIAAKRWGNNFHTLLYTGPHILRYKKNAISQSSWQMNSNFHYMIPGTRNFVGVEFNKQWIHKNFDIVVRPQMRVGVSDNLLIGIVSGIPVSRKNERFSTFLRIIYEPGHRHLTKQKQG